MSRPVRRRAAVIMAAGVAVALVLVPAAGVSAAPRTPGKNANRVDVQVLSFTDYHGHIEPDAAPTGTVLHEGRPIVTNGAAYLASHLDRLRQGHDRSLTVAAGDLIGSSTFTSSVFHDEPAVETLNAMGLDVSSVGNHEFDEGITELLRMRRGGCHPVEGCFQEDAAGLDIPFAGTDFPYLGANVVYAGTTRPGLPRFWIKTWGEIRLGFIGMTLEGTGGMVSPTGIAGYDFMDEVEAGNAAAAALARKGVNAIVVLLHEGGVQTGPYSGCVGVSGPILDIAARLSPKVDALITGHTHQAYTCTLPDPRGEPRKVVSAASYGRIVTEMTFTIDRRTHDVVRPSVRAVNHLVTRDVAPDLAVQAIVDKWTAKAAGPGNRIVGSIGEDITRAVGASGHASPRRESSLSNLIADAQRESTGAQVAFMNPEAVRSDLRVATSPAGEAPGLIAYREAWNAQPFGNTLQTFPMTGAQIDALLEQQWITGRPGGRNVLRLGISAGFTYRWSQSAPFGSKVDPDSIALNGVVLDPNGSYLVTVNDFLAGGGSSFAALVNGAPRTDGRVDLDALIDYMTAHPALTAPPAARSFQVR